MDAPTVLDRIHTVAAEFATQHVERQQRRHLEEADFARVRDAGYLGVGLPVAEGGLFESFAASTRPTCEILRTLAHGDPSVALVCAMHPAVLSFWLCTEEVPEPDTAAWRAQRTQVFDSVREGALWGTITSEPGSGGDIMKTRAVARRDGADGPYRLTGEKHFGSGSGVSAFMTTTAVVEEEQVPDLFFVEMRGAPWDGSTGVTLLREWDGHGMCATQSHAFRFEGFPATRIAWPGQVAQLAPQCGAFANCLFTAVIVGVVENAVAAAQAKLAPRSDALRPYEQVEWIRAQNDAWLIQQAYAGMLRATETEAFLLPTSLRAKTVIAELAEALLGRICKVLGGGTFSRSAPFSGWAQDVRALGFLRPPWGLAFDQLNAVAWLS